MYYTLQYRGIFVLGVKDASVNYTFVTGELGSGTSPQYNKTLDLNVDGSNYRVFEKTNTGSGDPSVTHLWIIPMDDPCRDAALPDPVHTFDDDEDCDDDRVSTICVCYSSDSFFCLCVCST